MNKYDWLYKIYMRFKSNQWLIDECDISLIDSNWNKYRLLNNELVKRGVCKSEYNN